MADWQKPCAGRLGTSYIFTLTGTSQTTSTFGPQTYMVRVASSQIVWLNIGNSPVAATTGSGNQIVNPNYESYFTVTPGQQAAVIQNLNSGGTTTITEMS